MIATHQAYKTHAQTGVSTPVSLFGNALPDNYPDHSTLRLIPEDQVQGFIDNGWNVLSLDDYETFIQSFENEPYVQDIELEDLRIQKERLNAQRVEARSNAGKQIKRKITVILNLASQQAGDPFVDQITAMKAEERTEEEIASYILTATSDGSVSDDLIVVDDILASVIEKLESGSLIRALLYLQGTSEDIPEQYTALFAQVKNMIAVEIARNYG